MIKINFNNKMFTKKYRQWVERCYASAVKTLKIDKIPLEVNIAFIGKAQIKKLNNEFRNTDRVTDVLSFPQIIVEDVSKLCVENYPHDINFETNNLMLGDLYICVSKVKSQSVEYGTGLEREMCYMAIHGLLHLLGYDHIEPEDKIKMRKMEEKILGKLQITR